jgi:hypothetical protein
MCVLARSSAKQGLDWQNARVRERKRRLHGGVARVWSMRRRECGASVAHVRGMCVAHDVTDGGNQCGDPIAVVHEPHEPLHREQTATMGDKASQMGAALPHGPLPTSHRPAAGCRGCTLPKSKLRPVWSVAASSCAHSWNCWFDRKRWHHLVELIGKAQEPM